MQYSLLKKPWIINEKRYTKEESNKNLIRNHIHYNTHVHGMVCYDYITNTKLTSKYNCQWKESKDRSKCKYLPIVSAY